MATIYSINEDEWYDDLDEMLCQAEQDGEDEITHVYVAEKQPYTHSDFIFINALIDDITNVAYDEMADLSDEYINSVYAHFKDDANKSNIKQLIATYFDNNIPQPNFYKPKHIKYVTLDEVIKGQ